MTASAPLRPAGTDLAALPAFTDAGSIKRLLARLAWMQGLFLLLLLGLSAWSLHHRGRLPAFDTLLSQGAIGAVCAALALSLTGLLACWLLARGRALTLPIAKAQLEPRRMPVSVVAGWPQAVLVLVGAALAVFILWRLPPMPPHAQPGTPAWPVFAGLMLVPAFLLIICERFITALPVTRLPEAGRLATLLRLPPAAIFAHILLIAGIGFGLPLGGWTASIVSIFLYAVAAELALRTLSVWYLPLPTPQAARACIGSIVAAALQPGALRPSRMARQMRTQFGIDITRSWAVAYARSAAAPVLLALIIFTWGLSGVVRIGIAERGSYERFGAPVAILGSGMHLILPWPFGHVRRVEYGVVHTVAVGATPGGMAVAADTSTADGLPPLSANRLWDQQLSNDTSYIIASEAGGRQSFQVVSVDMNVIYRIGLDDESARRAIYGTVDSESLVRSLAGRELAHLFATRTLTEVLGERHEELATQLKSELQEELDARDSGVEVLSLVVDSLHPPSGAVTAYRGVQTAEIVASMRYSQELGRAQGVLNVAESTAHDMHDQAQAASAELVGAASQERWRSDADTLAYRQGGRAFLVERYFSNLRMALARAALEIVDHRLGDPDAPIFDLRPVASPPGQTTDQAAGYSDGNSDAQDTQEGGQ